MDHGESDDMDLSRFSRLLRYQKLSLFLMEAATDDLRVQQRGVALVADFRELNFQRFRSAVGLEDHFCCRFFLWPRSVCEIRCVICLNSKIGHAMDVWNLMTDRIVISVMNSTKITEDIKRGLRCWVGSFPCRVRRIWLLAAPTAVRWLTGAVTKFLSSKAGNLWVSSGETEISSTIISIEHEGGVEICSNIRALVSRILNSADWSQRCCHRWHLLDARWGIGFAWRRRWRTSLRTLAFATWTAIQRRKKGNEMDLFLCLTYLHMFMIYIYIYIHIKCICV